MSVSERIRAAIEIEGSGPSEWAVRDCISLIRSVIEAQGVQPSFGLPEEMGICIDEADAVVQSKRVFGSLKAGWLAALNREPALIEWDGEPDVGMIGLTADDYTLDGQPPTLKPALAVFGPELLPLSRTPTGLAVAHPIVKVWRVLA